MNSLLDGFLTLKQCAHVIDWGESTLRRKMKQAAAGQIPKGEVPPWIFYNGQYRFHRDEVVRWFVRQIERRV